MEASASSLANLEALEQAHPGLRRYIRTIADFLAVPFPPLWERFAAGVARLPRDEIEAACRQWEAVGILPEVRIADDAQVAAVWSSPLFQVFLHDALQFFPPADVDITAYVPPPCAGIADLQKRPLPPLLDGYWKLTLQLNLPELYLDPFLDPAASLLGCDLACGWGRASLTLRRYENRRIFCCDYTPVNLQRLDSLARRAGLRPHLALARADITTLPFAAGTFDFFLAFDIFEHLTNAALARLLPEILRCAKIGAVLYTETPLRAYCPAVTHIQDFTFQSLVSLFKGASAGGKRFRLKHYDPRISNHFTFEVSA